LASDGTENGATLELDVANSCWRDRFGQRAVDSPGPTFVLIVEGAPTTVEMTGRELLWIEEAIT
jgi:hypothetical protein